MVTCREQQAGWNGNMKVGNDVGKLGNSSGIGNWEMTLVNQNRIQGAINSKLSSDSACYRWVQSVILYSFLSKIQRVSKRRTEFRTSLFPELYTVCE